MKTVMKFGVFTAACSIFLSLAPGAADAAEIVFETDVRTQSGDTQGFSEQKSGTTLKVPAGSETLVVNPKGLPLLIVVAQSKDSVVRVSDASLQNVMREQMAPLLQSATEDVVREMKKAELLIQKRDLAKASALLTSLKQKYPGVSAVYFLSGTVNYLQNSKPSAIEDLEAGLRINADDESAKKLLARLKGGA